VKGVVENAVSEYVSRYFEEHPPTAKKILEKAVLAAKAREAARRHVRSCARASST
jgi:DNA gyrase subunit B